MGEAHAELEMRMHEQQRLAAKAQADMEAQVANLQAYIAKKKEDLKTMQQRLVSAKSSYDTEVVRKQSEVQELETSLRTLQDYTQRMQSFTSQVQGQIMTREQDMKVQLGLMKNTIAFALYIDETLQVDLTDPHSTQLLVRPTTVFPSGVTYSAETVEQLQADAKKKGEVPRCPQVCMPLPSHHPVPLPSHHPVPLPSHHPVLTWRRRASRSPTRRPTPAWSRSSAATFLSSS